MAIDVWMQHPTERFLSNSAFDSLRKWIPSIPKNGVPLETTIKSMDAANIKMGLISAWHGPTGPLISNEEVSQWVQQYPDRFMGLAAVDLSNPMNGVRTLRKFVKDHGFKGLRIVQWLWEKPCTDALYYPLFAECIQLDVPVCLQVGMTGPLHSSEAGRPLHIERIALDFPELKIVCGHIGYPWDQEMIAFATKFPNVYIDTSAYKSKRYPAALVAYIKTNGRKKVMFGSNYPMLTHSSCLEDLSTLELGECEEDFLTNNAKRVFKI